MAFKNTWTEIQTIPVKTQLPNWTAFRGYSGEPVTVVEIGPKHVTFHSPTARNVQRVPIDHFEKVYKVWEPYVKGKHLRKEVVAETRYSRYIINTFQWLCERHKGTLP